jgi:hypothetical protein
MRALKEAGDGKAVCFVDWKDSASVVQSIEGAVRTVQRCRGVEVCAGGEDGF